MKHGPTGNRVFFFVFFDGFNMVARVRVLIRQSCYLAASECASVNVLSIYFNQNGVLLYLLARATNDFIGCGMTKQFCIFYTIFYTAGRGLA